MKELWKYITMIVLLAGLSFSIYSCNQQKIEKEEIINQNNINRQVNKVEDNQGEIDNREADLYPAIEKDLDKIDKIIKDNKKVKDEVKKANIYGVAHKFTQLGYSSSVLRK